jgi:hypothetical protein
MLLIAGFRPPDCCAERGRKHGTFRISAPEVVLRPRLSLRSTQPRSSDRVYNSGCFDKSITLGAPVAYATAKSGIVSKMA